MRVLSAEGWSLWFNFEGKTFCVVLSAFINQLNIYGSKNHVERLPFFRLRDRNRLSGRRRVISRMCELYTVSFRHAHCFTVVRAWYSTIEIYNTATGSVLRPSPCGCRLNRYQLTYVPHERSGKWLCAFACAWTLIKCGRSPRNSQGLLLRCTVVMADWQYVLEVWFTYHVGKIKKKPIVMIARYSCFLWQIYGTEMVLKWYL